MPELVSVLKVQNELGEGVIWSERQAAFWWTDIEGSQIYRYRLADDQLQSWSLPERLGCFALVTGKDYLIGGFETGFAYFAPETDYFEKILTIEADTPNTRLNDGRADRQGRFWAGSMVEGDGPERGALYCLDGQLECTKKIGGLSISNGLCWSPDSAYMYHTDTPSERIDRFEFDSQNGDISNSVSFAKIEPGYSPDGSTVDAEGYIWNAQWGGSQVVRYSPEGEVDLILPVPASQPTCVAFGGAELNMLIVTSATQGLGQAVLDKEPDAGNVFIYKTETRGLPDPEFKPA